MRSVVIVLAVLLVGVAVFVLGGGKSWRAAELKRRLTPLTDAATKAITAMSNDRGEPDEDIPPESPDTEDEPEPASAIALFEAIDRDINALKQRQAAGGVVTGDAKKGLRDLEARYRDAAVRWGREFGELIGEQTRIGVMEAEGQAIDADVKAEIQRRLEEGQKWKLKVKEKLLRRGARLNS
jgi:hypothetical protein